MELSTFAINILVATCLAIIIGLERELSGHKGSIKISVLITLGACIFVSYEKLTGIFDDDRMAANVVTGVGFLCSGFIFKNGLSVTGLGTASTLWCSSAIGVLCAGGHRIEALIVTGCLFLLNILLSLIQPKIKPLSIFDDNKKDTEYMITIVCLKTAVDKIKSQIISQVHEEEDTNINTIKINDLTEDKVKLIVKVVQNEEDIKKLENIITSIDDDESVFSKGWQKEE